MYVAYTENTNSSNSLYHQNAAIQNDPKREVTAGSYVVIL